MMALDAQPFDAKVDGARYWVLGIRYWCLSEIGVNIMRLRIVKYQKREKFPSAST